MKSVFINLLLLAFASFVSLIVGEFLARGYLWYQDEMIRAKNSANILTQVPKKELFTPITPGNFTNRANAVVRWWDYQIRTDSLGCRTGMEASDSANIILFIGDSMIFGLGLPDSSTIPSLLQKELNQWLPHSPFHVINAGVIGYDFQRYLYRLKQLAPVLRPELVVVGLCYNDLLPNEDPYGDAFASFASIEGDSAGSSIWIPKKSPQPSELSIIKDAFRSSALYILWTQARSGRRSAKSGEATTNPLKRAALKNAPQTVNDFLRTAHSLEVAVVFVYFPVFQSLGQESDLIYFRLLQEQSCVALDLSHSPVLSRESYFYRENRGHLLPDIHFNESGSRAVAKEIAHWLLKNNLWGVDQTKHEKDLH